MILSPQQQASCQRVTATCNDVLPRIEFLEALGAMNPTLAQRAKELRDQREYQKQLADTALELNRQMSKGV